MEKLEFAQVGETMYREKLENGLNVFVFPKPEYQKGYAFFPIMAPIHHGVDELLNKIYESLSKLPPIIRYEAEPAPVEQAEEIGRREVTVRVVDGIYVVEGKWLLNVMRSVNFDDYESLQYFQRVLINAGVIDALRRAGVQEGDTVSIYDLDFDFVE